MKFVPTRLVKAHYRTLVDARTDRPHWPDYAVALGPPIVAAVVVLVTKTHADPTVSGGVLTASGLFAAFLFGAMLQVSQRALEWVDTKPERGPKTSQMAINLEELAANAGYSSLMAVIAAVFFLVCSATPTHSWVNTISLACGVATGLHMILGLVLVMNRVFLMTQGQLRRARAGGSPARIVPIDPERRSSSGQ